MTITLSADQERAVRDAIRAGKVTSVDEFIARAIANLPKRDEPAAVSSASSVFAQGPGLFGSPEDASLLDEVVSMAYQERRRPSKRETTLQDDGQGDPGH